MEKLQSIILTIVFYFIANTCQAQVGVFHYSVEDKSFPNTQVIDILEDENNHILALCSSEDINFRNTQITTLNIKTNGELLKIKHIDQEDVYNLVKIIKIGLGLYKIYGNTTINKSLSPLSITIDDILNVTSKRNIHSAFSTYVSDIYPLDKTKGLVLYTRKGKNNTYEVVLNKEDAQSKNIDWIKTVSTSNNEEANKIILSHNDDIYVLTKNYEENLNDYTPKIYKLNETGNLIWAKTINVPSNFYKHFISIDKTGNLIYACGYTRNQTGGAETKIFSFNQDGELFNTTNIKDFSANGIFKLSNGNHLLYGSTFYIDLKQVVTKGKFVIIDNKMNIISNQALSKDDKPDSDLKGNRLTSSELYTACELNDDRIVVGGKIFMPTIDGNEYNQPLLIICNPDGSFR